MSTQQSTTVDTLRFVRTAALCCIVGAVIATIGTVVTALLPSSVPLTAASAPYTPTLYRLTQVIWAISCALILVGIVGLARSQAAGSSGLGRIGLWLAILGQGALVLGNLGFALFATATVTDAPYVFLATWMGIASLVTAIGFVLAGSAVLRARRWQGWQRWLPLFIGLYVFVVFLPILTLAPDFFNWPLAVWSASFGLLGVALYQRAAASANGIAADNSLDRRMTVKVEGTRSTSGL